MSPYSGTLALPLAIGLCFEFKFKPQFLVPFSLLSAFETSRPIHTCCVGLCTSWVANNFCHLLRMLMHYWNHYLMHFASDEWPIPVLLRYFAMLSLFETKLLPVLMEPLEHVAPLLMNCYWLPTKCFLWVSIIHIANELWRQIIVSRLTTPLTVQCTPVFLSCNLYLQFFKISEHLLIALLCMLE